MLRPAISYSRKAPYFAKFAAEDRAGAVVDKLTPLLGNSDRDV